jgi:hypothetical protein
MITLHPFSGAGHIQRPAPTGGHHHPQGRGTETHPQRQCACRSPLSTRSPGMMRLALLTLRSRHCCHSRLTVQSPYINKPGGRLLLVVFCIGKASAKLHKRRPHTKATESAGVIGCETVVVLKCVEYFRCGLRLVSNTSTATRLSATTHYMSSGSSLVCSRGMR